MRAVMLLGLLSCTGREKEKADSGGESGEPPFECGISVPDGVRLAATAQDAGGDPRLCVPGIADTLATSATELDAFVSARETCSAMDLTQYGMVPSDEVDWTSEHAVAATLTESDYGWKLGALAINPQDSVTHVDWCQSHNGAYDEPGTYLVVYAIPSDWPTVLESTYPVTHDGL